MKLHDIIALLASWILIGILGNVLAKNDEQSRLEAFYKDSCIALPNQTSIMKWVDGKPQCSRIEYIRGSNNLKDWKDK